MVLHCCTNVGLAEGLIGFIDVTTGGCQRSLVLISTRDRFICLCFSHRFTYGYLVTTSPRLFAKMWSSVVLISIEAELPWCDGRCVQDPRTYSPWHADPRLLAIPTSCTRVAEYNPNWDGLLEIGSASQRCGSL